MYSGSARHVLCKLAADYQHSRQVYVVMTSLQNLFFFVLTKDVTPQEPAPAPAGRGQRKKTISAKLREQQSAPETQAIQVTQNPKSKMKPVAKQIRAAKKVCKQQYICAA